MINLFHPIYMLIVIVILLLIAKKKPEDKNLGSIRPLIGQESLSSGFRLPNTAFKKFSNKSLPPFFPDLRPL